MPFNYVLNLFFEVVATTWLVLGIAVVMCKAKLTQPNSKAQYFFSQFRSEGVFIPSVFLHAFHLPLQHLKPVITPSFNLLFSKLTTLLLPSLCLPPICLAF